MLPVEFPEANVKLLKPENMEDDECLPLPVFTNGVQCISKWRPSLRECLNLLLHRTIWLSVMSGSTQPPVWIELRKTVFVTPVEGEAAEE